MKLIVSELDAVRRYVSREFYYTMSGLIKDHGWMHIETRSLWTGPGTIKRTLLKKMGELPQTILFWEGYEFLHTHAADISRLDCRKILAADDLHWWEDLEFRRKKLVSFALCETVLSTYAYVWNKFYPEFCGTKKVVWIPHSASPDFMLGYNHRPEDSILLSGALSSIYYPLRQQMMELHSQGSYSIAYHCHPGYHYGYDYDANEDVGRGYARTLNSYRAGFTDSPRHYKYVVAKYFEIPATGALLLADDAVSGPLKKLGFIRNKHYVPVSKETLRKQIRYVLDERNHREIDEIRQRGQRLVWEKHKTSDRARQIDNVCSS